MGIWEWFQEGAGLDSVTNEGRLPHAVTLLRKVRRGEQHEPARVAAADPLNLRGILTPDERVSPATRAWVEVG